MNNEPMNFDDISLVEVPVTIAGEEYLLVEATEATVCKFRNATFACTQYTDGKVSSMKGLANVEPLLVSLCLIWKETRIPVKLKTIESWPNRVVTSLFERAKKISGLNEDESLEKLIEQRDELNEEIEKFKTAEEAAKNLPETTTDTSD